MTFSYPGFGGLPTCPSFLELVGEVECKLLGELPLRFVLGWTNAAVLGRRKGVVVLVRLVQAPAAHAVHVCGLFALRGVRPPGRQEGLGGTLQGAKNR